MFSRTVRLSARVKCWWTMPTPAARAARGWPGGAGRPMTSTRAGVGDVVAEEDVHQRGLAGAVLAEKGDDLALGEGEADGIVGDLRAETLGDAVEAEDDRAGQAGQPETGSSSLIIDLEAALLDRLLALGDEGFRRCGNLVLEGAERGEASCRRSS